MRMEADFRARSFITRFISAFNTRQLIARGLSNLHMPKSLLFTVYPRA